MNPLVLCSVNQKGGTGKTVTAANLAWTLAETRGLRVLALDMDPQGNLTTMLGTQPSAHEHTMVSVFLREKLGLTLADCVVRLHERLDLVVGSAELADVETSLVVAPKREERLVRVLRGQLDPYDVVVIDLPPNPGLLAVNGVVASDGAVVPIRMDDANAVNGLSDLTRFLGRLAEVGWVTPIVSVVRLDVDPRLDIYATLNAALAATGLPIAAAEVPSRTSVAKSVARGIPITRLAPRDDAAVAYRALTEEIYTAATALKGPA